MLGISWAIINPLLIMFAITFVFTWVFKASIDNYPFFVLAGIMPWMFFSNALSEATTSIQNQQNIMRQFSFPCMILPLSSILANFLNFLISWVLIYPIFLFFNPKIIFLFPFLPVILFLQLCLVSGLGLTLAVLNVFFRDIGHLLGVVLMFWFWVTPVFYQIEMVPERFLWIYNINPMTSYVVFYEKIVFGGAMPSFIDFVQVLFWALFCLISGLSIYIKLEQRISKSF